MQLLQQTMRPGLQSLYKVAGIEAPTIIGKKQLVLHLSIACIRRMEMEV